MSRYETTGGTCPLCGLAYGYGSHGIGFCVNPQPITSAPVGLTEWDVRRIVREEIARFDRTGIHAETPAVQPTVVQDGLEHCPKCSGPGKRVAHAPGDCCKHLMTFTAISGRTYCTACANEIERPADNQSAVDKP